MWISINNMNDAPKHDCLVAYIHIDQHITGDKIDDLCNLGAGVGWLHWAIDKKLWGIMDDGEPIDSTHITALCEIPAPKNLTIGKGGYPND